MTVRRHWVGALILAFSVTTGVGAKEEGRKYQDRESPGNQKAWREAQPPAYTYDTYRARAAQMAVDLLPPPTRTREAYGKGEALEDLWNLASEIQALYDLRSVTVLDREAPGEIETHSSRSLTLASHIFDFINGGTGIPMAAPVLIPTGNFHDRVERLMGLFIQLIDPTVQLVATDVLDLGSLDQVRAGFGNMEAWIRVLSESEFLPPPRPAER